MRHRYFGRKLSRNAKERTRLFRSLVLALILNQKIKTTEAVAKTIQGIFDKLIVKAKLGTISSQNELLAFLKRKKTVKKLTGEILPLLPEKTSGFTRIFRLERRRGDNAPMVQLEIVRKLTEEKPSPSSEPIVE